MNMPNEASIRDGFDGDGLLNEPKKQLTPVPGRPTVEAEGELVQVIVQMGLTDAALMSAKQPPFEKGDHTMHPRQEFEREVGVPSQKRDVMAVAALVHSVVSMPSVRMDDAPGLDDVRDESLQTIGGRIGRSGSAPRTRRVFAGTRPRRGTLQIGVT
jgi:hypothetical protein